MARERFRRKIADGACEMICETSSGGSCVRECLVAGEGAVDMAHRILSKGSGKIVEKESKATMEIKDRFAENTFGVEVT